MNLQTVQQAMLKQAAEDTQQGSIFPSWAMPVMGASGLGAIGSALGGYGAAATALAGGPAAAVMAGTLGNIAIRGRANDKLRAAEQKAAQPVPKSMQDQANALRVARGQAPARYPSRYVNGKPVYDELPPAQQPKLVITSR